MTEEIAPQKLHALRVALLRFGLELMEDKKTALIEKIKTIIIEMIRGFQIVFFWKTSSLGKYLFLKRYESTPPPAKLNISAIFETGLSGIFTTTNVITV
ncbi:MAG: hypothetical protein EOO07_31055 [Chitinophagaceae bacterium]|nr:MAG: hypothetical protein EOO07_31055 [Chitinophagaceae bacterium]